MNYLSVCSGVEAASVAWKPLAWKPIGFSEIEKFPSEVLQHHYPQVTNFGDMTKYKEWNINEPIELLVGGTPCQSFSVAGLRKGLEDPRGNLALVYCGILDHFKPKWFIWENVPGVLSSNSGRDFGSFLGAVAELGYGFAYRVLDAQYFGVAQRRRRVFVVGYLGDWRPATKVLFESDCLSGNPAPSREAREKVTPFTPSSFGNYSEGVGTIRQSGGDLGGGSETLVTTNRLVAFGEYSDDGTASTIKARDYKDHTDLIAYEWHNQDSRIKPITVAATLNCNAGGREGHLIQSYSIHTQATQFAGGGKYRKNDGKGNGLGISKKNDPMFTLTVADRHGVAITNKNSMSVRRLTPIECERLQGFPDNYTNIKDKCPDGPRYKAMGNSMAVPVMSWIGKRIHEL